MEFSVYIRKNVLHFRPGWDGAKKIMADVNFLKKLLEFDKEHISEATLKKIKVFLDDPEYDPVVTLLFYMSS